MKNILTKNKAKIIEKVKSFDLLTVVNTLTPQYATIQKEIEELKKVIQTNQKKN